jgi:hypothetical protein
VNEFRLDRIKVVALDRSDRCERVSKSAVAVSHAEVRPGLKNASQRTKRTPLAPTIDQELDDDVRVDRNPTAMLESLFKPWAA